MADETLPTLTTMARSDRAAATARSAGSLSAKRAMRFLAPIFRGGWVRLVALAALVFLIGLRIWDPSPIESLRLRTFDLYQWIEPRAPAAGYPVVIVDVDEESLGAVGQWPWARSTIADLVLRLFQKGAVVVGFDMVFPEPDRVSPDAVAGALRGLTPEMIASLKSLPSNDSVLADIVRRTRVVLGQAGIERDSGRLLPPPIKTPFAELGGDPRPHLFNYPAMVRNLPELETAAQGRGMFSLAIESDNVVRRVPAVVRVGADLYPSLAIEMLRVATGQTTIAIRTNAAGIESAIVAGVAVPTDDRGRIWVHFALADPVRYVSAKSVLDGSVAPERIAGKLVLIGTSAAGLRDIRATPISPALPGVEVHAQLIETILARTHLVRPNYAVGAEVATLLMVGLLLIVLVPMVGAWWTLLIGGVVAGALVGGSWHLYGRERMLLDPAYPALAALLVYTLLTFLNYTQEEASRRRIRTAFARYLAPEVVARLARDPAQLRLGGEMREMTLMFTDVEGFTRISERFDAVGLTELINKILTPLTGAILETGGTVDKYMGDAIMAFWNAPLDDPNHARHACLTALAIRALIGPINAEINRDAAATGRPEVRINVGVGLNSGACCVGNMGSDQRFDYSVLGDVVNIASRLEGQTRSYGVGIIAGEMTREAAGEFAFLEIDRITVKGKSVPLRIFTLVGDEARAKGEAFNALRGAHDAMVAAYRAQDWDAALHALSHARAFGASFELGRLYDLYEGRINEFRAAPPPADWDGVYVATTKG